MYTEFIQESNMIEGITRYPTDTEIEEMKRFMSIDIISVDDIIEFVSVYQPNAKYRNKFNVPNVKIGNHIPYASNPNIDVFLWDILNRIKAEVLTPCQAHHEYEALHPFTDGNGRSGRALWLWQCKKAFNYNQFHSILMRGFLHSWYYQSLSEGRI